MALVRSFIKTTVKYDLVKAIIANALKGIPEFSVLLIDKFGLFFLFMVTGSDFLLGKRMGSNNLNYCFFLKSQSNFVVRVQVLVYMDIVKEQLGFLVAEDIILGLVSIIYMVYIPVGTTKDEGYNIDFVFNFAMEVGLVLIVIIN